MAINNVYVGKAEWGYFIDIQCDNEHNGNKCECKNIDIVQYKNKAIKIGKEKSKELNVPLLTDWDDDYYSVKFCGYCGKKTKHNKNICKECGSDNTKIQGFNSNLM